MDIPLNTIRRFNENTFLYSQFVESSRLTYYADTKPYNLYFLGNKMLFSTIIIYSTLKAFLSGFGSISWVADIYEIQIKKVRFAIYNRSIYIYGYNSLVPVFVYDDRHGEILVNPLVFYDTKSTLYFVIRKYIIFFIISRVNSKVNIRLITQEELENLKIVTVKRETNDFVSLLNKLNISLNVEVEQPKAEQMKQTTQKDDSDMDYIPF